jgi:hypothetical protein
METLEIVTPGMTVQWAYRNMSGLYSELPLQAIKVHVHVLVCCFAILLNTFSVWKMENSKFL